MSDLSDLDNLLAELDHIEAPKSKGPSPAPAPAAPKANTTPVAKAPAPQRASAAIGVTPKSTASKADWDELDALVAKFESAPPKNEPPANRPTSSYNEPASRPASQKPAPAPMAPSNNSYSSSNSYSKPAENNRPPTTSYSAPPPSNNSFSRPAENKPARQPTVSNNSKKTPTNDALDLNSIPEANDFDSRGNSSSDDSRRATVTMMAPPSSNEVCQECGQIVIGEHLMAMGKKWHMDHFRCSDCRSGVVGDYYEYDGQPKCRNCFETKYVCSKCGKAITGEYYTGGGKLLHATCIERHTCAKCRQQIDASSRELNALEKYWHPDCFVCTSCATPLSNSFYNVSGMPYCDNCAEAKATQSQAQGNCGTCGRAITNGSFITYGSANYHSNCFLCHMCRTQIDHSSFYDVNGKPTCHACATK